MLEDKLLLRRFKNGDTDAMQSIYRKYENYLLTLAITLTGSIETAEDIVHSVFCAFIENRRKIKLRGNMKSYLATCTANLARDKMRASKRNSSRLNSVEHIEPQTDGPDQQIIWTEESRMLSAALNQLPFEQREVIVMHLRGGMKFREIAGLQDVSIDTIKSRYRYGLDKLRSILNDEMIK
ncbi:MAG: RNA polymerase sigma factor [Sedimentisphaerales bacterium]|nr:RNA polymerase sigma factor [Sedimentisphaerales bacterium]